MKIEVTTSTLLTLAIALLTVGVGFLENGDLPSGLASIVVGFAILVVTTYLIEHGIVQKFMRKTL